MKPLYPGRAVFEIGRDPGPVAPDLNPVEPDAAIRDWARRIEPLRGGPDLAYLDDLPF